MCDVVKSVRVEDRPGMVRDDATRHVLLRDLKIWCCFCFVRRMRYRWTMDDDAIGTGAHHELISLDERS